MNVVFLSPHFPPNWYQFCVGLRDAGANVLGLGDADYGGLRPELRAALDEYYRVGDMHDYDQLLRALGHFTHRHGKLDRLDSLNEYWLETEAFLRTDFNIPGIRSIDIERIKRKSAMKRIFQDAGQRVARGGLCRTLEETRALVDDVGFPVVAKPDIGVGAARTFKIHDETELAAYWADKPSVDYIVEEFVSGTIVTYDGLTDADGRIVFDSSLVYSTGVMESVNLGVDLYYYVVREIPQDLAQAGEEVARAFDVRERPFHFEFFRLGDGSLMALEVNMRPPGGLTVDMLNYANDFDFYREWANVVVRGEMAARVERPYFCAYVGRKPLRRYALDHDEIVRRYGDLIAHHQRIDDVFAAAIGSYGYVLRHPTLEPLMRAADAIHEPAG